MKNANSNGRVIKFRVVIKPRKHFQEDGYTIPYDDYLQQEIKYFISWLYFRYQ